LHFLIQDTKIRKQEDIFLFFQNKMPRAKKNHHETVFEIVKATFNGLTLALKIIYEVAVNLVKLAGSIVRLALLAIVGIAMAIFLFCLSIFFLTKAFGLPEDRAWDNIRTQTIDLIEAEIEFSRNWLRLQNTTNVMKLKDQFLGDGATE